MSDSDQGIVLRNIRILEPTLVDCRKQGWRFWKKLLSMPHHECSGGGANGHDEVRPAPSVKGGQVLNKRWLRICVA